MKVGVAGDMDCIGSVDLSLSSGELEGDSSSELRCTCRASLLKLSAKVTNVAAYRALGLH